MSKTYIYCDESGETSFSVKSQYKYFAICALVLDEKGKRKMKNTMKKKKAKLYKLGWPKDIEIKANVLHSMSHENYIPEKIRYSIDGDQFILGILKSLKNSCSPRINYIIVNKEGLKSESFRKAPYGIAYNYFAGKILIPLIHKYSDCHITIDKRNKEKHSYKEFDGYIETEAYGRALDQGINIKLELEHDESYNNNGLQAVDFFTWSIYRAWNSKDRTFVNIFNDIIDIRQEWYCK